MEDPSDEQLQPNIKMQTLTTLDKTIIRRLYSYLPLPDKLKLVLIHASFADTLKDTLDRDVLSPLDLQNNFSVNETIFLLSNYGTFIRCYEHISTSRDNSFFDEYFRLIEIYCPNFEEITLHRCKITSKNHYGKLLAQAKELKTLTLKNCTVRNGACSQILSTLSQLQRLDLENTKVKGENFGTLTNLIDLNLKNCRNFECTNLIDVFKSNRLKSLNIVGVEQFTKRTLEILLETQSKLEKLTLGAKYCLKNVEQVCTLRSLREISIVNTPKNCIADYMKVLVVEKKDSIESFEVYLRVPAYQEDPISSEQLIIDPICKFQNLRILSFRNCVLFDQNHLVHVAKACRQLEMLDLSGSAITDIAIANSLYYLEYLRHLDVSYCHVTTGLYFRISGLRRELGFTRPLVIYIKPEMYIADLLKSKEYLPAENRVWLTFNKMRMNYEESLLDRLTHLNDIQNTLNNANCNRSMNQKSSDICQLIQLDDNCLFHIIHFLKRGECLKLFSTSERFASIAKYFFNTQMIQFRQIFENFTTLEARRFLSRYGFMIRRLQISYIVNHLNMEYLDLIVEYCTNLVDLYWDGARDTERLIKVINASANTLETLNLEQSGQLSDFVSLAIAKAHNLRALIIRSAHISGLHLSKLTNLIILSLQYCKEIRPEHFIEICKSNCLLTLNIEGCTKLDEKAFHAIAETQKNLKRIALGEIYVAMNMHVLADLESLEHIKLASCQPQKSIQFLWNVCEKRRDQIKSLAFQYYDEFHPTLRLLLRNMIMGMKNLRFLRALYTGVSDEDLMLIVNSCTKIEILDVRYQRTLSYQGLLYPIKELNFLQHYNVSGCELYEQYTFYLDTLKLRTLGCHGRPLTVYINEDPNIVALSKTKEFTAMKKYTNIDYMGIPKAAIYDEPLPKKRGFQQYSPEITSLSTISNQSSRSIFKILDLPDRCIAKIASYLEPIDRLKLASIDSRLVTATRSLIFDMVFDLNAISQVFTVQEAAILFRNCNNLIERIKFRDGYYKYLELIEPYSQYLVEIQIEDVNFLPYPLEKVLNIFASPLQKLRKIIFTNFPFVDEVLNMLSNKEELRVLQTTSWADFEFGSIIHMNHFFNLNELYLPNCCDFELAHLREICLNCKLKVLDLRGTLCITAEVSQLLLETQNDCLQNLAISDSGRGQFSDEIAKLNDLKFLTVEFGNFNFIYKIDKLVDKLIMYHSKDLLSLKITCRTQDHVDYSWFQKIEARRCKFSHTSLIEIQTAGPCVKRFVYF